MRILGLLLLLLPVVLDAQVSTGDETRRTITITYGTVDTVTRANMQSQAGANAIAGGILGAVLTHSRRDRGRNAAIGALAAGLVTKAAEGRHRVDEITIRMFDGSMVKVLQDHLDGVAPGGCVSLEQGAHTNVRAVSPDHCGSVAIRSDTTIMQQRKAEAGACERAKGELAHAQNEERFEFASRKIRALCG